ncbi:MULTISPECIES: type II toxin-antitoxin system Phd/YefM family antitoxin [Cellulomonas]|uniref:Type II toxin-antitoxin system Phd/YefM family antitoxin n=1 Tax=Cellulomonas avistercoris TaxID=2762242 RepID=A0ABR8QHL0_9CELL|nr:MULTISPECIES: type II toxin-antitoxin system Phd/YefM family antitoxin [Cellulomonas]MBD7919831.1 type II toxin-antitoxin system Phd/YefM family antitoxin [Cellulomonas avistercoris]MBO3089718.1 type II toxin-antitoxin system Phd/YefM family antitoxin [Cellulomonas dongxiuzhuiae]
MRTVTATHASRGFSDLLDAVERGETVQVTRAGHVVAELRPATPSTGRRLREALAGLPPLDDDLESDIDAATSLLTDDGGPWDGA